MFFIKDEEAQSGWLIETGISDSEKSELLEMVWPGFTESAQEPRNSPLLSIMSAATAFHQDVNGDHGRIETRRCWATDDIDWLRRDHDWTDLKSIALVERTRTIGEKTTVEIAYFITSLGPDAAVIANAVRAHWGIENQLHWVLDVSFREDQSRIRTGHAAENMAMVRHLALSLLKRDLSKGSLRAKQKRAGWDTAFLQRVLTI